MTMLQTEIKRENVNLPVESETVAVLAEQAETLLGYSALKKALDKSDVETPALARCLRDLEIAVLNQTDVAKYKAEHMKEVAKQKFAEWLATGTDRFYCPGWDQVKLENYTQPIPEFVLNKAVQIKRAYPDVQFFVEQLNENPDPFLIAKRLEKTTASWNESYIYDAVKEEYYVEVWAEPKFESAL